MTPDDDDDRPDHVGTDTDETPFDHGCDCSVCQDYREEVHALAKGRAIWGCSDRQREDARRLRDRDRSDQARLKSF
jgi:hypothetical protein